MKTIGFIDLYISEWHANNYPAWIKQASKDLGLEYEAAFAWAEEFVSPVTGQNTDEWCKEYGVKKCETIKELCEKSDYIIILAPSNPEVHLRLVEQTFPYAQGKRIYIDKTFAPNFKEAKQIFDLAEKYNISFFTTSALRYASEIENYKGVKEAIVHGGGGNFEEYVIHQAEMVVKTMGVDIARAKTTQNNKAVDCLVEYKDGRKAEMHFLPGLPFTIKLDGKDILIESDYFKVLMEKTLVFFETGKIDFDNKETLAVMSLRDASLESLYNGNSWVEAKR